MKRIYMLLLAIVMCFGVVGCVKTKEETVANHDDPRETHWLDRRDLILPDGKIILDGVPGSYDEETDIGKLRITKLDGNGEILWSREYSEFFTPSYWESNPLISTQDGGFVAVIEPEDQMKAPGSTRAATSSLLVKLDANGDVLWKTVHFRGTHEIRLVTEGTGGDLYTYGYSFEREEVMLQKYDKDGHLQIHTTDVSIDWSQTVHYQEGIGWIVAGPNYMACYDGDLNEIWQVYIMSVDAVARYYEDAIYWGGGGQGWQGDTLYKVSYDGDIMWGKDFDGVAKPMPGGVALVFAEGESAVGITLVDMETEEVIKPIEQLNDWHYSVIDMNSQQFTIEYFNAYYSYDSTTQIQVTYDLEGNVLSRQEFHK